MVYNLECMKILALLFCILLLGSCHFLDVREDGFDFDTVEFQVNIEGEYVGAIINCSEYPHNQLIPPVPFQHSFETEDSKGAYIRVEIFAEQYLDFTWSSYTVEVIITVNDKVKQSVVVSNSQIEPHLDIWLSL